MERDNVAARRDTHVDRSSPPATVPDEYNSTFQSSDFRIPIPEQTIYHNDAATSSNELSFSSGQSVQVFPAPAYHAPESTERDATTVALSDKVAAPYDRYEAYLKRLHKQLQPNHSSPHKATIASPKNAEHHSDFTYSTSLGNLTFSELYERTRKYAAFVLRHTYQVNESDIDDGLQAGYLRLWQRLEEQPHLLEDKSLAWIGIGLVYSALHATRRDWQFQQQTRGEREQAFQVMPHSGKGSLRPHSGESRQTEIRIDVQQAIGVVAERILNEKRGKKQDHDLWALYGLTMQQVSASELSRLFGVRKQSMQAAYNRIRGWLQEALPNYMPKSPTTPMHRRGRERLPQQDIAVIKQANEDMSDAVYEAVKAYIAKTNADTQVQDEIALEGIRGNISAQTQSRRHNISQTKMQGAYTRVHLMIGAERDPTVRVRRPEQRVKHVFTLTPESGAAVETLALEFLEQPKSYEKLVALHAHISNLAISTTAKHFNVPTSTLRYYAQQIGRKLMTPVRSARET